MNKKINLGLIFILFLFFIPVLGKGNNSEISDKQFLIVYSKTILRSQHKLTKMHKSGLGAIGRELIKGDKTGTCFYKTAMAGVFKIRVTVEYKNYRDFDITLNGKQIITVSWISNGNFKGTVKVSGKYKGSVRYDLDIKKGTAAGKYYYVKHLFDKETKISYLAVQKYFEYTKKRVVQKRENEIASDK